MLAHFLADGVFAAAADTSQFVLGKLVDDFDTGQVGRQRLAFTTTLSWCDDLFFRVFVGRLGDAFCFVEKG
ncbi:hypothetical protein D3C75_1197450 [compost metagenome]